MHYKPSYLPYNDTASELVKSLADQLGLSLNQKHEIVLASFLALAKNADSTPFKWMVGNENKNIKFYSHYPNVGVKVINKVRSLLMEHGLLSDTTKRKRELFDQSIAAAFGDEFGIENAADAELLFGEMPKVKQISEVTAMVKGLDDAIFVEANLPEVLVNLPETWVERVHRQSQGYSPKRMSKQVAISEFKAEYSKALKPLKQMNAYWQQHPLFNPIKQEYYAAATRVFHNNSIKSGGRYYGGWSKIPSDQRLQFTIDEEPVCEIDLNASLPTLLSCLVSKPMRIGETWTDAYQCLVDQLPDIENARDKVKQVFVELIGTGNPNKREPTKQPNNILENVEEFILIRDLALDMYPALNDLNKEYFNFTDALSFHEANILTNTLLQLKQQGVVAYPIHDCVLVKEKHQSIAVKTFRAEFSKYVSTYQSKNNLSYLTIKIPVSIESKTKSKVRLEGRYILEECATGMRNSIQ